MTDGIESALDQARAAAGDKDIRVGGGGDVVQQYLAAGLVDRLDIHIVPVLLGSGTRLFSDRFGKLVTLETARVVESPTGVVHASYRVSR